jgi:hypothetical protein
VAALRAPVRAEDRVTTEENTINAPARGAFLGLAKHAVAAAAVGAIGTRFIETAEAMPAPPDLGLAGKSSDLVAQAQWWGSPSPGCECHMQKLPAVAGISRKN